jgi:hypothetical protein
MKALDMALMHYQLIHGLGAYPSNHDEIVVNLSSDCTEDNRSGQGFNTYYQCKNFSGGYAAFNGNNRGIVFYLGKFSGSDGSYSHFDLRDGRFVCRERAGLKTRFRSYCEEMGYEIINT